MKIICSFRKLNGPRVDGGWVIQFDVPEVLYHQIKDLPLLDGKNLVVNIDEYIDDNGNSQRDLSTEDEEPDDLGD
jgi:hypothetical protein